jgi:hypothetical protein
MSQCVIGPVQRAIRASVREGDQLLTPTGRRPFWVGKISSTGIVLELGAQRTPTTFKWEYLEGVVPYLDSQKQVPINGSGKDVRVVAGTLDGYLKLHVNRLTAGWVAVLLEKAGIIKIQRSPPATVRLA